MKKYEFTIRKVLEKNIEIEGENKKQAFEKVIKLLALGEKIIFKNIDKNNEVYEIKMNKVLNENHIEKEKDIEKIINKIMQKVELNLEENSESFNENNEEIEDNLIVDTDEITCQKCGNHISLEKFL